MEFHYKCAHVESIELFHQTDIPSPEENNENSYKRMEVPGYSRQLPEMRTRIPIFEEFNLRKGFVPSGLNMPVERPLQV